MKLHLPVRLFRAVMALMAVVATTVRLHAEELPTPTVAPEGYITTEVKSYEDLQYYTWQDEKRAFILQDNMAAEWGYQYGYSTALLTSYYKDYPASLKLIGSVSAKDLYFDHLGTLHLTDNGQDYDPYYDSFGIVAGNVTFDNVEKVHMEGCGTAIEVNGGYGDGLSHLLTMRNCGDLSFIYTLAPELSEEQIHHCAIGINHWSDSKYDAVVLTNNGHVSITGYLNGAINSGDWNSNVVLSDNEGLSITNNYRADGSAGITSQYLTIASNGDVLFDSNRTETSGGAICAGQISMTGNGDITFRDNQSAYSGGAIYSSVTNETQFAFDGNSSVLFKGNSAVGNGGAISISANDAVNVSFSGNEEVVFADNSVIPSESSDWQLQGYGGALYVYISNENQSELSISDNGKVEFVNNQAEDGSAIYIDFWYSYLIDISRNKSVEVSGNGGISAIHGDVSMNDNGSINISSNEKDAIYGKVSMYGNEHVLFENNGGAAAHGGEFVNNRKIVFKANGCGIVGESSFIGNDSIVFSGNKLTDYSNGGGINGDVLFENNRSILFVNNVKTNTQRYGTVCGGAINASDCTIKGNGQVVFSNNSLSTYYYTAALGGAIYANNLQILDNESVLFTENYARATGAVYVMNSLSIRNNGDFIIEKGTMQLHVQSSTPTGARCEFSTAEGNKINLYEGITINAELVSFNDLYVNSQNIQLSQTGDIVFSGKLYNSDANRTSKFTSLANLYDGKLIVEDGAIINGKGITVHSSVSGESTSTLLLNNGVLKHDKCNITMESGTSLSLMGANSITASAVVLESGSKLAFTLSGDNLTTAALTLTGALNVAEGVTLTLGSTDELLEDGRYILLSLSDGKQPTSWTKDNITISSVGWWRIGYDDLQWQDGQLSVNLSYTEWTNATGNALWNMASENWQKQAVTTRITPGAALFFGDTGAGVVTVEGEQAPGHIIVDNSEGADYLWQAAETGGTLMGAARLVKRGKGELTINLDNNYSGGTVLYDGVLTAGSETAFGTGDITVHGGVLNLAGLALENNIAATGGTLAGASACSSNLVVDGDVTLADDSTFGGVSILGGSIGGGALVDTSVMVNATGQEVSIESDLTGSSSLVVNGGQVVLKGANDYTGGTVINNGSLTFAKGSGLGSGDITLNGGWLDLNGYDPQGKLTINGGSLVSGYVLSTGDTLTVGSKGMKMLAELRLAGGRIHFEGTKLEALSGVSATEVTTISVANIAMVDAEGAVMLADFGEHALHLTAESFVLDGYGKLVYDEVAHTLSLELTDVNKWAAVKNAVWQNGDSAGWEDGATFVTGNRVEFARPGKVQIAGEVEPASVLVNIDETLSFQTSYNKKQGTWSGSIVGSGCVVKRGNGVLTLNDGNTYSGGTYIEGGTVVAGGAASFGTGAITISGDYLDLKGKAVANDINLTGEVTIKGGKNFLGIYTQTDGMLLKNSMLNIAENATLKNGTVNGTLSGVGTVEVTGHVTLGTTGKITTNKLDIDGTLSVSSKGLAMNTKASNITVNKGALLTSEGAIKAYAMELNGGSVSMTPTMATSVTLTDSLHLHNTAHFNLNGKLTAKGNVTVEGGASLYLSGALSAKNLTLGSGSIFMTGSKLQTIKVGNELTLNGGTELNLGFTVTQADVDKSKVFKLFTFKVFDADAAATDLYSLLGLSQELCTLDFDKSCKAITLVVNDMEEWNKQAEAARNGENLTTATEAAEEVEDMLFAPAPVAAEMAPELQKVADTLVQCTWGTVGASRAFTDTIANRGAYSTLFAGGRGAAWVSTMGGSSRISSDGGHAGADYTLTGAAFGIEARVTEDSTIGLAIGNSWGKVNTLGAYAVDGDYTHQGIYGNHKLNDALTLSWAATHTRTEADATILGMPCDWSQDALQLDARLTWTQALNERTAVSVFGGMQYLATDKGECNGLSTGSLQNLRAEIGVGASHKFSGNTMVYGELSFVGDMVRNNPTATVGDARARGANPGRAGLNLSTGATHRLNEHWSLNGSYNFEWMQNVTSHSLNVGASYNF